MWWYFFICKLSTKKIVSCGVRLDNLNVLRDLGLRTKLLCASFYRPKIDKKITELKQRKKKKKKEKRKKYIILEIIIVKSKRSLINLFIKFMYCKKIHKNFNNNSSRKLNILDIIWIEVKVSKKIN